MFNTHGECEVFLDPAFTPISGNRGRVWLLRVWYQPRKKKQQSCRINERSSFNDDVRHEKMDQMRKETSRRLQALEQRRQHGRSDVQMKGETSRQRHDASARGVIRYTPSDRTHALHPRPIEEQQGTCHYEKDRDHVPSSRPGSCDDEKGFNLGGESFRGGIV